MKATLGLIDIQVNGFAGIDFNNESITGKQLDFALEAMLKTGVTTCLPTIITADEDKLVRRFKALDKAVNESQLGPIMVLGYHLEGPFLNSTNGYAGCHPTEVMAKPNIELIKKLDALVSKPILLITYAPEFDVDFEFAQYVNKLGKCLAIGHSNANYSTLQQSIRAGLKLSTHLGNGVPQQLHKLDNTIQAQLSCDELYASFIADGLHIPSFALKNLLRCKPEGKAILVTDAVSAAACDKTGMYPFADMMVERVQDGTVRVPNATNLAGSSLTLDQAIRNLTKWEITSFAQSIRMATQNPAQLLKPTCDYYGLQFNSSQIVWNDNNQIISCKIGNDIYREFNDK